MNNIEKNLTVLIGTCDKYHKLWDNFQICFDRYWKFNTKNIFVSEKLEVPTITKTKFDTITFDGNSKWGARMLRGVESCQTDYIYFILDDYFLNYEMSNSQLDNYLQQMKLHNMDRLQISPSGFQQYQSVDYTDFLKFKQNSSYLISMQPSIWNKRFLQKVLSETYSPWDFEIRGSALLKKSNHNIFIDKSMNSIYFNAVRKGFKKSSGWDEFKIKENLKDF